MDRKDAALYFALNTIVFLLGVVLWVCGESGISASLIAAGVAAYIVFFGTYVQLKRSQADRELLATLHSFGVDDIKERRLLYEDYAAARVKTNERLDIMGFGLRNFTEDCGEYLDEWSESFEIRMLVVHPDSVHCDQRDYEEGDPTGKIREDVLHATRVVTDLDNPRVRIRWYRAIPVTNILRMDDVMWVGPYFIKERSRNAYVLKLKRGGRLFDEYLAHFERVWSDPNLSCEPEITSGR